jgi:NAD(P)-dependent dehydrogenase (short-subunit alcohol dehydrogenase family)
VADVGNEAQFVGALEQTAKKHGSLDILVNNAMAYTWGGIDSMTTADWHANFSTSVDGTFWGTRTALKLMAGKGGSIVNISSICGTLGTPICRVTRQPRRPSQLLACCGCRRCACWHARERGDPCRGGNPCDGRHAG